MELVRDREGERGEREVHRDRGQNHKQRLGKVSEQQVERLINLHLDCSSVPLFLSSLPAAAPSPYTQREKRSDIS